ncbi:bidirectional sugar transporter SWEET14-like [Dendrobium catenatum]|uniref:bidirectional sugar transporter SWEET14-like n=1 Tax=Dendrobium catenatum TaxID=906689 RepID=UPI0010A067A3|nr:bidirectional sugar transporter SWEET14-like [Dendrobium catenatum]
MVSISIENPLAFGAGLLGNILSFLVALTPMTTFYKVYRKKSTGSFQSTPYVVALSSAMLWLYYAFLNHNVLLLTINTCTCALESVYIAIYLFYASKKIRLSTVKMIFFFNVGLFGSVLLITLGFLNERKRSEITGWICASFAVAVFVAPLSIMRLVIRTKSVEYMPFSLSLFLTLSAIAWFFYGLLLRDFFVALPNVLGILFGVAQIILYFIYMDVKNDRLEQNTNQDIEVENITNSNLDLEMAEKHIPIDQSVAIEHAIPADVKADFAAVFPEKGIHTNIPIANADDVILAILIL